MTPFQLIIQPTKPNGQPWDGLPNELRNLGCPSFMANPTEIVTRIRADVLGFSTGATAGDGLIDRVSMQALDTYSGGLFSRIRYACQALASARQIHDALFSRFDAPDVVLRVLGPGSTYVSRVFEDANAETLRHIDRYVPPVSIPCDQPNSPITVSAVDRDLGTRMLGDLLNTEDPIGTVGTSLGALGAGALCAGFAYVAPDDVASGIVALGMRVDAPNPRACGNPLAPPANADETTASPGVPDPGTQTPASTPSFAATATSCRCVPGRAIEVTCQVTNSGGSVGSTIVDADATTGTMGSRAIGRASAFVQPGSSTVVVINAPIAGAIFNCASVGRCSCAVGGP